MKRTALPVTPETDEPEIPYARHQRNSQRSSIMVVISGDGELLTSAHDLSGVGGEMKG